VTNAIRARLEALRVRGALDNLDAHFAAVLARLAPQGGEALALAAALASRAAGAGHACIDLSAWAGSAPFADDWSAPPLHEWRRILGASHAAGTGEPPSPLVLDGSRLYLHRYWRYETEIAADLRARAARMPAVDEGALAAGLARLFPAADPGDQQRVAAERAVRRGAAVISGGPGTGKTTTVARVLTLLLEQSPQRPPSIALAAPTGKAAARMQSALAAARPALGLAPALDAVLPDAAQTLHRLLGLSGSRGRARHDAAHPLPVDVLVIDEASMIDLALMARVLDALPAEARLVLLGDRDQLASVEPGAVFAAVCAGLPRDAVTTLSRSHRFPAESAIGRLAAAIRSGDAESALDALGAAQPGDAIAWHSSPDARHAVDLAVAGYAPLFAAVEAGAAPADCFAALERFRVLCATRVGPLGADAINRGVIARLRAQGRVPPQARHFVGQPLLVTRNDYGLRLFNGDVGVVVPDGGGGVAVAFPSEGGGHRLIPPSRLSACESVYGMTIHKSQGSELDTALVLPGAAREGLATRELLYTGVTRVRHAVALMATPDVLAAAIRTRAVRDSGLEGRLAA
jgi:exodeoxyribonuclease V alpha subunit